MPAAGAASERRGAEGCLTGVDHDVQQSLRYAGGVLTGNSVGSLIGRLPTWWSCQGKRSGLSWPIDFRAKDISMSCSPVVGNLVTGTSFLLTSLCKHFRAILRIGLRSSCAIESGVRSFPRKRVRWLQDPNLTIFLSPPQPKT